MTRRLLLLAAAGLLPLAAQDRLVPLDEAVYQKLIASARGKVLLVNFWATWCEPCRAEMPALDSDPRHWRLLGDEFVLTPRANRRTLGQPSPPKGLASLSLSVGKSSAT